MAIVRTFNGAAIIKPGAYSKIVVENLTGFPLLPTGTVGIVGEAVGGKPRVLDILSREGIQDAKSRYKSGPIADVLELLVNPSNDPRIANGASKIVVYKVNDSTQSSTNLQNIDSVNQILLKSKNYGDDENNVSVVVSAGSVSDLNATIFGSVAGPYVLAGGETLLVRSNNTNYVFTNTLVGAAVAASALITELNTAARWSGSLKPVIASASATLTNAIDLALDPLVVLLSAKDYGYLKIDAASTLDTITGHIGSARGRKGSRILTFRKGTTVETLQEVSVLNQMSLLYTGAGTAAALTIQDVAGEMKFTTSVTGVPADNLSFVLKNVDGKVLLTLQELVDRINDVANWTAVVLSQSPDGDADQLDYYNAMQVKDVAGVLKRDIRDTVDTVNSLSQYAEATKISNVYKELKTYSAKKFFIGGTDGSSVNADWADAFEALKEERINVVVPLISKDQGALSVDSINASAAAHAAYGWSTVGRNERHAFVSKLGTKDEFKDAARATNSAFVSMVGQQVEVLDRFGTLSFLDPHAFACICAGLRAGAEVGEPLTHKLIRVNNMRVLDGSWNPKKDYAEMIEAGCLIGEALDSGGFRVILGNTTYSKDANFVFNRESVVQAAGYVAYDIRINLEAVFTGTKARTGTAEAVANFIRARMSTYLAADIIVGDDLNNGLGFKNLNVVVEGNTAVVNISITPVQGIDFILPTIYLSDIRQSA